MFLFDISINAGSELGVLHFGLGLSIAICLETVQFVQWLALRIRESKPNHEVFSPCFDAVSGCVTLPGRSILTHNQPTDCVMIPSELVSNLLYCHLKVSKTVVGHLTEGYNLIRQIQP